MTRPAARIALIALTLPFAGTALSAQDAPVAAPAAVAPPAGAGQADGSVTLAQFQAQQESRMMAADTDGDGRISLAEWTAAMNARRGGGNGGGGGGGGGGHHGGGHDHGGGGGGFDPSRMFDRIDANHDGVLDKSEIDAAAAERFRRMDTNGDGVITADERAAQHGGEGHRGGG